MLQTDLTGIGNRDLSAWPGDLFPFTALSEMARDALSTGDRAYLADVAEWMVATPATSFDDAMDKRDCLAALAWSPMAQIPAPDGTMHPVDYAVMVRGIAERLVAAEAGSLPSRLALSAARDLERIALACVEAAVAVVRH